jgi:type II secretory pathway component PulF
MNKYPYTLSSRDTLLFFKNLAQMTRSGLPLADSVMLMQSAENRTRVQRVYAHIHDRLSAGHRLSDTLQHIHVGTPLVTHLVRIGEDSGTVPNSLLSITTQLERSRDMRKHIMTALIYPCVIVCATLAITLFLITYLFPKLLPLFSSMHMALPLPTRIIMAVSSVCIHHYIVLISTTTLIIAGVWQALYIARVRIACQSALLCTPYIRAFCRAYTLALASRMLYTLHDRGVPTAHALTIVTTAVPFVQYTSALSDISRQVHDGQTLNSVLSQYPRLFPIYMRHMVHTGERSGTLTTSLLSIAEQYETEVVDQTKTLTLLIEPLLMICVGLIVGFIAMSIIMPIYQLTQQVGS